MTASLILINASQRVLAKPETEKEAPPSRDPAGFFVVAFDYRVFTCRKSSAVAPAANSLA
jgi:hypothetical protein